MAKENEIKKTEQIMLKTIKTKEEGEWNQGKWERNGRAKNDSYFLVSSQPPTQTACYPNSLLVDKGQVTSYKIPKSIERFISTNYCEPQKVVLLGRTTIL